MVGKCCGQRVGGGGGGNNIGVCGTTGGVTNVGVCGPTTGVTNVGVIGPTGQGNNCITICYEPNGQTNQTNGIRIPTATGFTTGACTGKELVPYCEGASTNVGFTQYCEETNGSTSGHNELICHGTDQRRKDLIDQIKIFLLDFDDKPCVVEPRKTGRGLTELGQYTEYLMKHCLSWTPPNPSPPLITCVGAHEVRITDDYERKSKENDECVTYIDGRTKPSPLSCDCAKRNGLQDQCTMIGCSPPTPQCLASNPGPCCPPSMGVKVSMANELCRTGGQSRRKTVCECGPTNKIDKQVICCNTQQGGGNTGGYWTIYGGTGPIGGQGNGCVTTGMTAPPPRPVICSTGMTAPQPRPVICTTGMTAPKPRPVICTTGMTAPPPRPVICTTGMTAPPPRPVNCTTGITVPPPRPVICTTGMTAPPPRPICTTMTGGQGQYRKGNLGVCVPIICTPRTTAPVTQPGVCIPMVGGQGQQGIIGGQGLQYSCVCNVGQSAMPSGKKYLCCPAP